MSRFVLLFVKRFIDLKKCPEFFVEGGLTSFDQLLPKLSGNNERAS